jgi:hypothetical protein
MPVDCCCWSQALPNAERLQRVLTQMGDRCVGFVRSAGQFVPERYCLRLLAARGLDLSRCLARPRFVPAGD